MSTPKKTSKPLSAPVKGAKETAPKGAPKVSKPGKAASKMPRRGWRSGRGTLLMLSLLLLGSAGVRLGGGTGAAIASAVGNLQAADDVKVAETMCETDESLSGLLTALQMRETKLAAREAAIADQVMAIELARAEIDQNLEALVSAEAALKATLSVADSAAENDLLQLTAVYENMKPKEAAALFETMDPHFSAGFLGRMQSSTAGAIMAGLDPTTAYTISVIMAGRNATVPSQ